MANKAQSHKHQPTKLSDHNKQNINPSEVIKPHPKSKAHSPPKTNHIIQIQAEDLLISNTPQLYKRQEEHYEMEILEFLIQSVRKPSQQYNYFLKQPDITDHMRMVLINWLIDVHLKYKLNPQTFFITVNIIDKFLEKQIVYRNTLQLVGITALWIASKYEETYQVPKISNLVYICDSTYSDAQILDMQSKILSEINFDFLKVTSFTYYQTLKRHTFLNEKDYYLGRFLLQSVLFDVSTRKYSELTIAASVIFFIQKLRGYEITKQQKIYENCGITYKQLRACARQISFIWQKINQIDQMASLRQKYMKPQFLQVAKIKIIEKNVK